MTLEEVTAELARVNERLEELEERQGIAPRPRAPLGRDHRFDPEMIGGACLGCGKRQPETDWSICV